VLQLSFKGGTHVFGVKKDSLLYFSKRAPHTEIETRNIKHKQLNYNKLEILKKRKWNEH